MDFIGKPEGYDDLDLIGYIYNKSDTYIFSFSQTFIECINKQRLAAGISTKLNVRSDSVEVRTDPMVTNLFIEMGTAASSGWRADLSIKWFPRLLLDYITFTRYPNGLEFVNLYEHDLDSKVLKNFLKEWSTTNPSLTVEDLNNRYRTIKAKLKRYNEYYNTYYLNMKPKNKFE